MDQAFFYDDWLKHPDFKEWIKKDTDNKIACFKYCKKSFALSNVGKQAVKSHTNGLMAKKHKKQCKSINILSSIKSKQENLEIVDTRSKGTSTSYQLTLD